MRWSADVVGGAVKVFAPAGVARLTKAFSVIGLSPDLIWRCRGSVAEINRDPANSGEFSADSRAPIDSLRALMAESAMADTGNLPPMSAGLFGYFGYDMIRHIEAIPDANPAVIDTPDSMLVRPSLIAIFDRLKAVSYTHLTLPTT